MNINHQPKPSNMIPAYLVAFLIHGNQVGIGILGYQRIIAQNAGHDAWISVIIAGLLTHLAVWIMIKTLQRYPSADLFGIHADVYGRWIGGFFNVLFSVYFIVTTMVILRNYIEIIQTWMFPEIFTWLFSAIFLGMVLYTVLGGIRIVAGYTFLTASVVMVWLFLDLFFPMQFARWNHLFPILEKDLTDLWQGAFKMSLTLLGFEIVYIVYPFIKNKERVQFSAQMGVLVTNLIYTALMLVTTVFFSQGQLMKTIWATLTIMKMVSMPFLERFEYIAISLWLFVIMPNLMMFSWSASRGLKRVFGWNQRRILYGIMLVILISSVFFLTRQQINELNDLVGRFGFYAVFVYPYLLYLLVVVKQAWRTRKGNASSGSA